MNNQIILPIIVLAVLIAGSVYYFSQSKPMQQETSQPSVMPSSSATPEASSVPPTTGAPQVTLHTTKGDIVIELYPDKAPITVANFLKLASAGFYNGVKFHRVIPNFMIQAGDPNTKGDDVSSYGMGGPGYTIDDEFANGLSNTRGMIAMANTGAPHSGGSQFFISVKDNSASLDGGYSVFGKVLSGMDVADAIVSVPRNANDMPNDPITITSVEVK